MEEGWARPMARLEEMEAPEAPELGEWDQKTLLEAPPRGVEERREGSFPVEADGVES